MTLDEAVALLVRSYQQGLFDNVRTVCDAVLASAPGHSTAVLYRDWVSRPAPPARRPGGFTVIWQVDEVARNWSRDWLLRLLGDVALQGEPLREVVDGRRRIMTDRAIVVDQKLTADRLAYYRDGFNAGCRFALIHLSDENYGDDRAAYDYCDVVWRQYWSPLHRGCDGVRALPLGYKSGLSAARAERRAPQRPLVWSFAGDPHKASRPAMLQALQPLQPHYRHLTQSFFDPAALDTVAYQALLDDSIFVPCPAGFINLDSFRVYEALECGCIPIVERRPGFDYFAALLGADHPLIVVDDWDQAAACMAGFLADPPALELRRLACLTWWRDHVAGLRRDMAASISRATTPDPGRPPGRLCF